MTVAPGYTDEGEPGQFHHLPYIPYPNRRRQQEVPDDSAPINAEYVRRTVRDLLISLDDMATILTDESHRVDEYRPSSLTGESTSQLTWQPDYKGSQLIEAIIVTGPTAGPIGAGELDITGTSPTPAAATIVTAGAPGIPGLWIVNWTVEISGAAASVLNNVQIKSPLASVLATADQPLAVGVYPQRPLLVNIGSATQNISGVIVATDATATYTVSINAQPYQGYVPYTLNLGQRTWNLGLPPSGIQVISPVKMSINESSKRILTSSVAGNWTVELMGITDSGRIGRPGSV